MASQQQSKQTENDPLLDQLEEDQTQSSKKNRKKPSESVEQIVEKNRKRKKYGLYIGMAVLGAAIGLGAHALFTNVSSLIPANTDGYIKTQEEYDDDTAIKVYNTVRDGQYKFNGEAYDKNSTVATFEKNGWTVKEAVSDGSGTVPTTLTPAQETNIKLVKDGYNLNYVVVENRTLDDIPLENANIKYISCYDQDIKTELPYGLKSDLSEEEAKAIFDKNNIPYSIKQYSYGKYYRCQLKHSDSNGAYYSVELSFSANPDYNTIRDIEENVYQRNYSLTVSANN